MNADLRNSALIRGFIQSLSKECIKSEIAMQNVLVLIHLRLVVAIAILASACNAIAAPARPNVVMLITDDQRADTIHALGNALVKTPNIDRLVKSGFVFQQAHCMGSYSPAVCFPSRTQLLTGQHMFHAKDQPSGADPATFTFPRAMRAAGYATLRSGKSSNYPRKVGTDFDRDVTIRPHSVSGAQEHAENAIAFIRENAGKRPFFLDVEFDTPHDPQSAPAEFYAMFRPSQFKVPENFLPFHPFDNGEMIIRDEATLPWPRTPEDLTGKLARYYASIAYTDAQIGRILDALEAAGQKENTIIVFASDNGLSLGEHGLLGKQNVYEGGGLCVPLIINAPGIKPGQSNSFVYLFDVFPTICDLCGFAAPSQADGRSLGPILRGQAQKVRDVCFLGYKDLQRAVNDGRWKLIRYPLIDKTQLFDLASDPHEMHDLAGETSQAAKVQELTSLLLKTQEELGDKCPLSVAQPKPSAWSPESVKLPPIKP
jgi:arylsulfatase A-like enzyme